MSFPSIFLQPMFNIISKFFTYSKDTIASSTIKAYPNENMKLRMKEIQKLEDDIINLEISLCEIILDMKKRRKTISSPEIDIMQMKINESEKKLKDLRFEAKCMIEKFNDDCYDIDKGQCLFPDLLAESRRIMSSIGAIGNEASLTRFSNNYIHTPYALELDSGSCELLDQIGGDGFSSVYKIKMKKRTNKNDDGVCIFKQYLLSKDVLSEEEIRPIEKEIELLSQLKHDNIVKIIGAIGEPNAVDMNNQRMGIGIIMEYCQNGSMRSILDKNNSENGNELNIDLIIHLLFGAAQGLEYLHDHEPNNILHGDIKSDNILVDSEYNAKICDFGISKLIQTTASSATKGGGTIVYKAPEAFDNKSELKSDVYSFGCVILEMLTGERPWKQSNNDIGQIVTKVLVMKEPHNLSKVRNDSPKELIDLMNRCLDYDKDNRPTIKQVKMELEKMMNNAILIKLDEQTEEYKDVESKFFPGGDKEGSLNRNEYKIVKIEKIKHLFAERLYQDELKRIQSIISKSNQGASASSSSSLFDDEMLTNERLLFHGTKQTNPMNILNHPDAFMKDYSGEGIYGKGLYFTELARNPNAEWIIEDNEKYSYRYNIEGTNQYQLLVCTVICGKSFEFGEKVNDRTRVLSQKDLGTEYHSIHGGPHQPSQAGPGDDDSSIYVVYKDTQVSPKYLITYSKV